MKIQGIRAADSGLSFLRTGQRWEASAESLEYLNGDRVYSRVCKRCIELELSYIKRPLTPSRSNGAGAFGRI